PSSARMGRPLQGARSRHRKHRDVPADVADAEDLSPLAVRARSLMRITFSEDPHDFVRRDWTEVAQADVAATFFHQPRYLKLYWEEFGIDHDPDHLLLAFAEEEDGHTVGAAAFE